VGLCWVWFAGDEPGEGEWEPKYNEAE
jgi:hypothetical protein